MRRQQSMIEAFPDMLDMLLICVESGLSINAAFARVSEEMADTSPILSREIALLSAEMAFLGDRRQAYTNFAERTGLAAARTLATSLNQADRYGTPVGSALQVLAQENREARMSLAEKKAASLPAKLTVPMILFFMPALFIILIGPAFLGILNR
jgi:tight adherence protein C